MLLGIDVGGTHTDAVLLDTNGLVDSAKVVTNHDDLLSSVRAALEAILTDRGPIDLERFNLSTTLCTNAIIQNELSDVGVLVSAGPGIDPNFFRIGQHYSVIPGGLDHRGTEIQSLDLDRARQTVDDWLGRDVRVFAAINKFSPRNPSHEKQMAELLDGRADFLTLGHTLSGQLNFPRRIATAYYNSAVWPIFNGFANSVHQCLQEFGLSPQLNILKADGGTMPFEQARQTPVESIFSGPAASIMGITSMCDIHEDALLLDIGGTTTDVAVFADGDPLIEAESIELEHRPTLVRAMKTKSIGLGGDSCITVQDGQLGIGPKRLGACLAQGGPAPTLVDALNSAKCFAYGDIEASDKGMQELGGSLEMSCEGFSWQVIQSFCRRIKEDAQAMLREINERPVYTVHEFLEYRKVAPKRLYLMGGPAEVLAPYISQEFGLPVVVPDNYAVANALGAAIARPTQQAELFADTEKRTMSIPVLGVFQDISSRYSLEQAKTDVKNHLRQAMADRFHMEVTEQEAEIIEESEMSMVKDIYSVGKDIRVKCQVKPGISPEYEGVVKCLCKEL
jgi:N-methylhydantoinase A/oxoprolinase/acetone carboxylase beta subunit